MFRRIAVGIITVEPNYQKIYKVCPEKNTAIVNRKRMVCATLM